MQDIDTKQVMIKKNKVENVSDTEYNRGTKKKIM